MGTISDANKPFLTLLCPWRVEKVQEVLSSSSSFKHSGKLPKVEAGNMNLMSNLFNMCLWWVPALLTTTGN